MAISVYKKDSSQLIAKTRRLGRQVQKQFPRTREGKREAELWILAQKNAIPHILPGHRSFPEALLYFTSRTAWAQLVPTSQKKYTFRLNEFIEFAATRGKLYLSEFSTTDAEAFGSFVIQKYNGKGRSARLILASSLFKAEIDRDDATITRNPFRNIKKNFETEKEVEFIEREELKTIMSFASEREQAIIIILYTTAMRASEFENLRIEDITPTKTYIRKRSEYKPKTKASTTFIPHGDVTWQAYQWLIANNPAGEFILLGDKRAHKSYLWDLMKGLRERIQLSIPKFKHFSPHSFRRSLSTHLAEENIPVPAIKNIMRHTSEKITLKYYIGRTDRMIQQAVEKTGGLVTTFQAFNSQQS